MAKFFISYSRTDRIFLTQLTGFLEKTYSAHTIWYDRNIPGGADWWTMILKEIEKGDICIAMLSDDALQSQYCRDEVRHAIKLKKPVLPIVVRPKTSIWEKMADDIETTLRPINYIDLSDGLTDADSVMKLVSSVNHLLVGIIDPSPPPVDINQAIEQFYMNKATDKWLEALDALKKVEQFKDIPVFFNVDKQREEITKSETCEHEYSALCIVIEYETRQSVLPAVEQFKQKYPGYDPDKCIEGILEPLKPVKDILGSPFEWCDVPAGKVMIKDGSSYYHIPGSSGGTFDVPKLKIAKYPITNNQFAKFVDSEDGYCKPEWWDYSPYAQKWRSENHTPKETSFPGDNLPRTTVCWYEAVAFCRWLSRKSKFNIGLPTEEEWQRAAQGDDALIFPWGNEYDNTKCCHNATSVVAVTDYAESASPFGLLHTSGNVLEWCVTDWKYGRKKLGSNILRVVRGGSWYSSDNKELETNFRFMNYPDFRSDNRGFRIALL